jgi:hypothetical protein
MKRGDNADSGVIQMKQLPSRYGELTGALGKHQSDYDWLHQLADE